jgi:hypothetical protein
LLFELLAAARRAVGARLAIRRGGGVQVDQLLEPFGDTVGDAGDHVAAVAVPDQDDVVEVLVEQHVDDILDVGVERDIR